MDGGSDGESEDQDCALPREEDEIGRRTVGLLR